MTRTRRLGFVVLVAMIGAWLVVGASVSPAATTSHVKITENQTTLKYGFHPASITVHKGDTIVWNNKSDAPHTVTFNNGSYNKTVNPGHSVSRTFNKAGTFKYHCNIHTYMHGTVTVTG